MRPGPSGTRDFPYRGYKQWSNTGYRGGDDDNHVLGVAPTDEAHAAAGSDVDDTGDFVELGCFDDGGHHCPVY